MVQGKINKTKSARPVVKNERSAKVTKKVMKEKKKTQKGGGRQILPSSSNKFRAEAELDKQITQAINKSNEQVILLRAFYLLHDNKAFVLSCSRK